MDEYRLEECDRAKGVSEVRRTAEHTKGYADACREVARDLGVVLVDLWSAFMAEAGWKRGMPLVGSKDVRRNDTLGDLLHDGTIPNAPGELSAFSRS